MTALIPDQSKFLGICFLVILPISNAGADFFGVKHAIDITWGHAVNSKEKLQKALGELIFSCAYMNKNSSISARAPHARTLLLLLVVLHLMMDLLHLIVGSI